MADLRKLKKRETGDGEQATLPCYAWLVVAAATDSGELPVEWREHYAELAAAWVREKGTLPPSLEALAAWASEPTAVEVEAEVEYLEGRGPDPICRTSD